MAQDHRLSLPVGQARDYVPHLAAGWIDMIDTANAKDPAFKVGSPQSPAGLVERHAVHPSRWRLHRSDTVPAFQRATKGLVNGFLSQPDISERQRQRRPHSGMHLPVPALEVIDRLCHHYYKSRTHQNAHRLSEDFEFSWRIIGPSPQWHADSLPFQTR